MSPEIRRDGQLIASVPDETGWYLTLTGKLLHVSTDGIDAHAKRQKIILESEEIGGRRELGLTHEGVGNSSKRRGDKKSPELDVRLLDRPIRVTYSERYTDVYAARVDRGERQTRYNPRWVRGHGQR